jgi:hypothetical protein
VFGKQIDRVGFNDFHFFNNKVGVVPIVVLSTTGYEPNTNLVTLFEMLVLYTISKLLTFDFKNDWLYHPFNAFANDYATKELGFCFDFGYFTFGLE